MRLELVRLPVFIERLGPWLIRRLLRHQQRRRDAEAAWSPHALAAEDHASLRVARRRCLRRGATAASAATALTAPATLAAALCRRCLACRWLLREDPGTR